jgi:glycosyltransferase involved in cell wall biosynthesis
MSTVDISVIICTWNRCELLARCLNSLTTLKLPINLQWEIIVINNNSTDSTSEILKTFQEKLPLKVIFEKRQGHSIARNSGLRNSQGELVLFTDDDVTVDPYWLMNFYRVFLKNPNTDYFGGTIIPRIDFPLELHPYLNDPLFDGLLLRRKVNSKNLVIDNEYLPFGANLGFRRSGLGDLTFAEHLGLKGKEQIRSEETDFINKPRKLNKKGLWVPSAIVYHWMNKTRLSPSYLWRYFVGLGRGEVRQKETNFPKHLVSFRQHWRVSLAYLAIQWGRRIESNSQ